MAGRKLRQVPVPGRSQTLAGHNLREVARSDKAQSLIGRALIDRVLNARTLIARQLRQKDALRLPTSSVTSSVTS